jgi:predicted RNA-binding protein with PUA-like domain
MQYWLFKSEPHTWSWQQQKAKGQQGESWNGVRNYQANNNMKAMQLGDLGFFYHSVDEKRIVGIVEVIKLHYPDHTDITGRFGMVDIKAIGDMPQAVTLSEVKANPNLQEISLIKQSRLSVQPVPEFAWKIICKMGGLEAIK